MLAFIENFQLSEGIIIAIVAVLIFGKRLPQVAGQAAAHVSRARRALNELWRESGLEQEMRNVQREVDRARAPLPGARRAPGAEPRRLGPPPPPDRRAPPAPPAAPAAEADPQAKPDPQAAAAPRPAPGQVRPDDEGRGA